MAFKPFHICLNASTDEESESESFKMMSPPPFAATPVLPYWPILSIPEQPADTSTLTNTESEPVTPQRPDGPSLSNDDTTQNDLGAVTYPPPPPIEGQAMTLTSTPTHAQQEVVSGGHDESVQTDRDRGHITPSPIPSPQCLGTNPDNSVSITVLPLQTMPLVLPLLYVSPAGLLTVLLRNQIAVEMTLDRALRVVNPLFRSVAATNSRGDASCIYHTAARIYQEHTLTEADLYWTRKAKLHTDAILLSDNESCYQLQGAKLFVALPKFSDLTKDMSVTLLFSSSGYGPQLMNKCQDVAQQATYEYHDSGAITVKINGVKIRQTETDDVVVTSGSKYLRVSPTTGAMSVSTHFVDMTIDKQCNVKVYRGEQYLQATTSRMVVSNGDFEAGFGSNHRVFLYPVRYYTETLIPHSYYQSPSRNKSQARRSSSRSSSHSSAGEYHSRSYSQSGKAWGTPGRSGWRNHYGGPRRSSWQYYGSYSYPSSSQGGNRYMYNRGSKPRTYYRHS